MLRNIAGILASVCLVSCSGPSVSTDSKTPTRDTSSVIRYAKRFSIIQNEGLSYVYLFGNRNNFDTTSAFILYNETMPAGIRGHIAVKVPCTKIAALSSIYAAMLAELGAANAIAAIDNIDYVNHPQVLARFSEGGVRQLARSPVIDLEQTVALRPDIVFTYGMGDGQGIDEKLLQTGIPIAVSVDHLEESPLARAEWIRFFAAFVGRDREADQIFSQVESDYRRMKTIAAGASRKPTVFSELKFGDVWYMPGGKSYVARLLEDASADYLWKHENQSGSLPLSFEQVYARARDADFWINLSMVRTRRELLSHDGRYAQFRAFKAGNLYNNNKVVNSGGYSTYWETGMIHPERILSDLIRMFHPDLGKELENDLYYYRQIK